MDHGADRRTDSAREHRRGDSRSRSIWRWQLILAFSTVSIAAVIALLEPALFTSFAFVVGLSLLICITMATIMMPWHRATRSAILVVPFLDILAIGFVSHASDVRLGLLWVFPIAWIASYYSLEWLVAAVASVSSFIVVATLVEGFSTDQLLRLIILAVCLGFIGTTILVGANRTRASTRLMRRQSHQLETLLARARLEERRRADLLDNLSNGVARIDRHGRVHTPNTAFRRIFGLEDMPHLHPSRAVEYTSRRGEPVAADETVIARAARGEALSRERAWLFDSSGRWRALAASTRESDDGAILLVEDITAEAEVSQERTVLARTISHELRSPLTAVLGHTDLLLERADLPGPVREQLSIIESAGERMEHLIARILRDPGRDPAETATAFDITEVARESLLAFGAAASAADVELRLAADEEISVLGDAFRLRQVVDNVVGNAVKYTPRGGMVDVSVEHRNGTARLVVSDTGIGIADDELAHVFDAYFRARGAIESGIPGTGLGMGITRDIVSAHGGTLSIQSVRGSGTTITIQLPAQR